MKWLVSTVFLCLVFSSSHASLVTTTHQGNLYFQFLSSEAGGAYLEFGIDSPTNGLLKVFKLNTFTNTLTPEYVVNMGFYAAGSKLDFYNSDTFGGSLKWAFSKNLLSSPSEEDLVVFSDKNNSLGFGGGVVQILGVDQWIFYLDSAWSVSYDDDDNEMVIKAWVEPAQKPESPVPEPATILLFGSGIICLRLLRNKA